MFLALCLRKRKKTVLDGYYTLTFSIFIKWKTIITTTSAQQQWSLFFVVQINKQKSFKQFWTTSFLFLWCKNLQSSNFIATKKQQNTENSKHWFVSQHTWARMKSNFADKKVVIKEMVCNWKRETWKQINVFCIFCLWQYLHFVTYTLHISFILLLDDSWSVKILSRLDYRIKCCVNLNVKGFCSSTI